MASWLWPKRRRLRMIIFALAALLLIAAGIAAARWDRLPKLESMGIGPPPAQSLPVAQAAAWTVPAAGSNGLAEVASNARFALYLEPQTSQIAVLNRESGYLWRSNPPAERLEAENLSGMVLENVQSPFTLEYTIGTDTRRLVANALQDGLEIDYVPLEGGFQATYTYAEQGLSFAIQYRLTEHGLEASVPDAGIAEAGEARLFSFQLLPYFGAVSGTEEEGYLFVPDGPGGLIHYDRQRPAAVGAYEFFIYGDDPANARVRSGFQPLREQISYPVFGMKRGAEAFAAIIKEGQYTATIKAIPGGRMLSYHSLGASFSYREEFGRKVSAITDEVVSTVQRNRVHEDRRIEYRFLSGDAAGYVGMAHAYQAYLEDSGQMAGRLEPVGAVPLQLSLVGGGEKPRFGGYTYEAATTFEQAEQIVSELQQAGVAELQVIYQGWQQSGRRETDQHFPIAGALGGRKGAERFISAMHDRGVTVLFEDFIGWKQTEHSEFTMKSDGIRSLDTTVLQTGSANYNPLATIAGAGEGRFIPNLAKAIRAQAETIAALKKLGVDGLYYSDGPGNLLYSDHNPKAVLSRHDTAFYYQSLLQYTRAELGQAGVYRGNAYVLGQSDFIEGLPFTSSYDLIIDETVPFYPITVHGAVPYSTVPANLRGNYSDELLRAIEYGALPAFRLTYANSHVLKDTDYDDIYSSEFAVWKERVAAEYEAFNKLSGIYHQRIVDHRRVADGVFATTYEDGTTVTVDYHAGEFSVKEGMQHAE